MAYPWNDERANPKERLIKLKGKDYLQVQDRVRWFIADQRAMIREGLATQPYRIQIADHQQDREQGWARHLVRVEDVLGNVAEASGSETKSDFGDYDEKSYTKALGRALALLGYATGDAQDFEESDERPADAPRPARTTAYEPPAPTPPNGQRLATEKQRAYVLTLCQDLGIDPPAHADLLKWSSDRASKAIEGMKAEQAKRNQEATAAASPSDPAMDEVPF